MAERPGRQIDLLPPLFFLSCLFLSRDSYPEICSQRGAEGAGSPNEGRGGSLDRFFIC
jgi:hypothetical protein